MMKATLRGYQQEALDAFLATGKGTLKIHPGGGKTIIGCAAIEALTIRRMGWPSPFLTLVVVPTKELEDQWEKVFDEQGITNYAIVTYAMAARKQTGMGGRYEHDATWFASFDLIIFDEAHHLAEGVQWRQLLIPAFVAPYALGLTSTPPLDPENPMLRVLPVLYERTFADGLEEGYAAPVEVRPIAVQLTEEERKKYAELTEEIRVHMLRRPGNFQNPVFTKRKMVAAMAEQKFTKLADIVDNINVDGSPQRILVWSEFISALEQAHTVLTQRGIRAEYVHGKQANGFRKALFENWGRTFQVLLAAKVAEEGIDYPTVAHGIILAGAKTSRQNVQRIGRLLRPMPGKTAKLWVIFCERTMEEKIIPLIDLVTDE
ncbi:DEAD/DEAH box helicase [Candidatus Woesearchaeota archaeon]|nr:DEAD/DEAH box helicase [Candidatus Woesearchaeota archaeon]